MTATSSALHFSPAADSALTLAPRRLVYTHLRQMTAMSAGLAALAHQAVDDGEASPEQLDHFATLSDHLTQQLTELTRVFLEMTGGEP